MAIKICRRTGKAGYRSLGEAKAALREIERDDLSLARQYERHHRERSAYKCLFCPRWHLSSQVQERDNGVNLR